MPMEDDDMAVITYKVLRYASDVAKRGAIPTVEGAYALADKPHPNYWAMVMDSIGDQGLMKGIVVTEYMDRQRLVKEGPIYLTLKGETFLRENDTMKKAKEFLGSAFELALKTLVISLGVPL